MAFTYSVMLDIAGRSVLVAGGGAVAARKIARVLQAGATVTVIAPACVEEIQRLAQAQMLQLEERAFQLKDIDTYAPFLVFAATDDAALNGAIAKHCTARGILVNAISDPKNGNFSVQSEITRARYAVSVSTFGQGPGFSKALREYLEPILDEHLDLALDVYVGIRQWLFDILDDTEQRTMLMRQLSLSRICAMMDDGCTDYDRLLERVKEWLFCLLD